MGVAGVSIVIAAVSVAAASTFYSFQIRNQMRVSKTDLVMRLYATWDMIEFDLVDDLLGNSTRQIWEKVTPVIREARERFDLRLFENFEYVSDEMTRRAGLTAASRSPGLAAPQAGGTATPTLIEAVRDG
jgi:hypothetical protein